MLAHYRRKHKQAKIDLPHYCELVRLGISTKPRAFVRIMGDALFYPAFLIRDITAKYARQRAARNQWHPLVRERCRPDGPTTRLYDLELAQGLHKEEGTSDPTDAW